MFKFNLLDNENVLSVYRQSEAVLFKPVLVVFVLIYFPWYFLIKYELVGEYDRLLFVGTVIVLLYAVNKYLLWLVNVCIITDKRLVAVSYKNLFHKIVSESPLERILNVSFSVSGFWRSLFKFGSVEIQVVGLSEPITFKNLSQPSEIKDFIWKIHTQPVQKQNTTPEVILTPQKKQSQVILTKTPVRRKRVV